MIAFISRKNQHQNLAMSLVLKRMANLFLCFKIKCNKFPFQGKQGEIRHVYRNFIFIHSREVVENGGLFVCKARHLELAGGSHAVSVGK